MSDPATARASYSVTRRLGIALTLVFAFGGIALAVAALAYGRSAAQQSFDRLLVGAASQIAEAIALRDGTVVADLPVSAFELLSLADEDRIVYAIYDRQGALVTGYDQLTLPTERQPFHNAEFKGEPIRVARVVRNFSERAYVGSVDVLVGQTLRARRQLANQITRNALIAAGFAGLAMSGLAFFAVRSALGPLRRIERNIASRAVEDLTPIDVAIPSEIESLVAALNRFMRRIDRQIGVMRTLIADASHQLRTPIAALRAQAELAQDETDPRRLQAILERIHTRSHNLSQLTDQLLNHALIIHRADSVPLERVDLRIVAMQAIEETDHALFASHTRPGLDLPEDPVWCRGDALSLKEACKNLLGNALRYGRDPVTLAVETGADDLRLVVRDAGSGIPRDHWSDAGTRYSRSSGVSPQSAGLGLAIVQAVATAHRGQLVFSHSGAMFEAALVLPQKGARQT
ncbi:sensor histidine kinase N-terminal domain-containing protein [Thalassococcus sp. CAU 1522]|uniref:histidine kinase n=1 Tax=Thalassococcus arenae TaxID=2851652 RepID=A0ABS6NC49_9RHOB|nr:sensor histidine kinase N-terminal domain-containing protein [Thalassococcus arenae]MBV2361568.1 sensor histidine kinase N-terminal domain-containing protein [Thalassococcus arenae]